MWITLNDAFLSVVAFPKGSPEARMNLLSVRARFKGDLERAFPGCRVVENGGTDYRFRTQVTRLMVADLVCDRIADLDYTNFKDSVAENWRHDDYLGCWGIMKNAQDREEKLEKHGFANMPRGPRKKRVRRDRLANTLFDPDPKDIPFS